MYWYGMMKFVKMIKVRMSRVDGISVWKRVCDVELMKWNIIDMIMIVEKLISRKKKKGFGFFCRLVMK